jgi:nitroreductase
MTGPGGHAAALAAVGLGYGSCQIGALYDEEVKALVGADGEKESVVYMTAVGIPG